MSLAAAGERSGRWEAAQAPCSLWFHNERELPIGARPRARVTAISWPVSHMGSRGESGDRLRQRCYLPSVLVATVIALVALVQPA